MNVVTFSSNTFIKPLSVMLVSLFENNKTMKKIDVYIIEDEIEKKNKDIIVDLASKYGRKISFMAFPNISEMLSFNFKDKYKLGRTVCRLCIDKLLPLSVEKVLCLDSDILIDNNLEELWSTNITDYYLAGVNDCLSTVYDDLIDRVNPNSTYCNAGMFLVNLKKWRDDDMNKSISEYIRAKNANIFFYEQTIMNKIFENNILVIHPKYNVCTIVAVFSYKQLLKIRHPREYYSEDERNEAVDNPSIIHMTRCFFVNTRPWIKKSNHPYVQKYMKYSKLTPFCNEKLDNDTRSFKKKLIFGIIRVLPKFFVVLVAEYLYNNIRPNKERKLVKRGKYFN